MFAQSYCQHSIFFFLQESFNISPILLDVATFGAVQFGGLICLATSLMLMIFFWYNFRFVKLYDLICFGLIFIQAYFNTTRWGEFRGSLATALILMIFLYNFRWVVRLNQWQQTFLKPLLNKIFRRHSTVNNKRSWFPSTRANGLPHHVLLTELAVTNSLKSRLNTDICSIKVISWHLLEISFDISLVHQNGSLVRF